MTGTTSRLIGLGLAALLALGCGDDGGGDEDAGPAADDCAGMADGAECGSGLICVSEACVSSTCGDGVIDPGAGEECEDGNTVAFDGCEPDTCRFTCTADAQCDDGLSCNGTETCADNACAPGTAAADGAACATTEVPDGVCRMSACVPAGCGNGVVDAGEDCDDMNDVDGDGCNNDCMFTCTMDGQCDDMDVCNGSETCDTSTNTCVPGTALDCTDTSPCTMDTCDAVMGCQFPLIDADMDGHASESLGACGTDCNDMRADVNPDEQEQCDNIDHDCDGSDVPPATPFWYLDCDGDTFATAGAPSMQVCTEPAPQPCGGGWTLTAPLNPGTTDCNDADADARPDQSNYFTTPASGGGYDYNCVNGEEQRYTATGVSTTASCFQLAPPFTGCLGSSGWTSSTAARCGVSAQFSLCSDTCIGSCVRCTRQTITRTQSCR